MPKIEKREHEVEPKKEEDVIVKTGGFRLYFQNYYTIISLGNDLLTGGLYFIGSLANLFSAPEIVGQLMYIAGGFFLLMRPVLNIIHNVFIYDKEEYQEEVVDAGFMSDEESKEEKEETEGKSENEENQEYNKEYYGEEEDQEEKKEKIEEIEEQETEEE